MPTVRNKISAYTLRIQKNKNELRLKLVEIGNIKIINKIETKKITEER